MIWSRDFLNDGATTEFNQNKFTGIKDPQSLAALQRTRTMDGKTKKDTKFDAFISTQTVQEKKKTKTTIEREIFLGGDHPFHASCRWRQESRFREWTVRERAKERKRGSAVPVPVPVIMRCARCLQRAIDRTRRGAVRCGSLALGPGTCAFTVHTQYLSGWRSFARCLAFFFSLLRSAPIRTEYSKMLNEYMVLLYCTGIVEFTGPEPGATHRDPQYMISSPSPIWVGWWNTVRRSQNRSATVNCETRDLSHRHHLFLSRAHP